MKLINFKIEDDLLQKLEEEANSQSINKSEFYRACLERGFDEITNYKHERDEYLVAFYVDAPRYRKLLELVNKYKLKMQKILPVTFEMGFDVYKTIDFAGFLNVAKGIIAIEDIIKKIFKKAL